MSAKFWAGVAFIVGCALIFGGGLATTRDASGIVLAMIGACCIWLAIYAETQS